MKDTLRRVRGQLWTVYVTLVSIVVGLALENLVAQARTMDVLWHWGPGSLLAWLQACLIFVMALNFWVLTSYLALALRWDIGIIDAASSLFFLVMLNGMIATVGSSMDPVFFWILGFANAMAVVAAFDLLRRARRFDVNADFIARFDHRMSTRFGSLLAGGALLTAVLLQLGAGGRVVVTVATLLLLTFGLAALIHFSRSWWRALGRTPVRSS